MAFAVICKSCQARFLLNDDLLRRKVAGRVVTVRCRQCHAAIEVDASNVEPKSATQHPAPAPPPPAPPATPLQPKAPRPAPSPPRPAAKSTLMGIGGPAKPPGVPELIALSPGLLHVGGSTTSAALSPQGFPEPPPPPPASSEVEELDGDWEVAETPALANVEPAPESLDDFAEELPPSLPPPEEELPSSTGTPSLAALTHHDDVAPAKPNADDFIANMHAAMNGGMMSGGQLGAPTIDVSALAGAPSAVDPSEVDLSAFDVPLSGKQTLPLFSLTEEEAKTPTPGIVGRAAAAGIAPAPLPPPARPSAPRPAEGSLSPAAVDRPSRETPRERRNVVAPATKSDPPASPRSRSALAAPLLLVVAVAAGFLIWKRTSAPATVETKPTSAALSAPPPEPAAAEPPPEPPAAPASVAAAAPPAPPADDITFEPAPRAQPAAQQPRSGSPEPAAPRSAPPSEPKPAAAEPAAPAAPRAPVTKDEPKAPSSPATPAEPTGPFDRAAAAAALSAGAAQASACRKEGDPSGVASVVITFAPSGRVTSATIGGPPFAGTATGGCIAAALRKARVPAFEGERVTVSKTIVVQ